MRCLDVPVKISSCKSDKIHCTIYCKLFFEVTGYSITSTSFLGFLSHMAQESIQNNILTGSCTGRISGEQNMRLLNPYTVWELPQFFKMSLHWTVTAIYIPTSPKGTVMSFVCLNILVSCQTCISSIHCLSSCTHPPNLNLHATFISLIFVYVTGNPPAHTLRC